MGWSQAQAECRTPSPRLHVPLRDSSQGRSGRKPAQPVRPASRPRQAESETRPAGARWRRRRSQGSPPALWLTARGSGRDQPQKRTVVHQAREQQPRPSQHRGWTRRIPRTSRGRRGTWGRGPGTGASGKMSPHAATGTDVRTAGTPPRGQSGDTTGLRTLLPRHSKR